MHLRPNRRFPASWVFRACISLAICGTAAALSSDPGQVEKSEARRAPETGAPAGLPEELQRESAIFLQRRLERWKPEDARKLLGEPRRRRDAYEDGAVTGDIYAYSDPTGRYREFELLFERQAGTLRAIFIYPWSMTWEDCRELWGDDVNTTRHAGGALFRSYRDRQLDVLVDARGKVISLGVYPAR